MEANIRTNRNENSLSRKVYILSVFLSLMLRLRPQHAVLNCAIRIGQVDSSTLAEISPFIAYFKSTALESSAFVLPGMRMDCEPYSVAALDVR